MTSKLLDTRDSALQSDDALLLRIRFGDLDEIDAGFAVLVDRYRDRLAAWVQAIVHDRHLAEDIAQEVFVKVFLKRQLYRLGSRFQAWLFHVARNQALSALRTRRRTPTPIGAIQSDGDERSTTVILERLQGAYEDHAAEEKDLMSLFERAVTELPEPNRRPFELCVRQGVQYKEAARLLGVPIGTVAIRIMRARQSLFQALAEGLGRLRCPPACAKPRRGVAQPRVGQLDSHLQLGDSVRSWNSPMRTTGVRRGSARKRPPARVATRVKLRRAKN